MTTIHELFSALAYKADDLTQGHFVGVIFGLFIIVFILYWIFYLIDSTYTPRIDVMGTVIDTARKTEFLLPAYDSHYAGPAAIAVSPYNRLRIKVGEKSAWTTVESKYFLPPRRCGDEVSICCSFGRITHRLYIH
jgi:hypothetical protein